MRLTAIFLTAISAASALQIGDFSTDLGGLSKSAQAFIATANTDSLLSQATQALSSLSQLAATASGPAGETLRGALSTARSELSNVPTAASTAAGGASAAASAAASASGSGSGVPAAGLAVPTVVPIAAVGAVGMAVLAML